MLIKINDTVEVITGDDNGKRGKVLNVDRESNKVLVEHINRVYKHVRRSQKNPQGGRLSKRCRSKRPMSCWYVHLAIKRRESVLDTWITVLKSDTANSACRSRRNFASESCLRKEVNWCKDDSETFGKYETEVLPGLKEKLGRTNRLSLPKIEKIVVNMGVGAATQEKKVLEESG